MSLNETQVVQAIYEAFGQRDLAKVFGFFSPDIEIVQSEQLPWGGRYCGHSEAQRFFDKLTSTIRSKVEIEKIIHAGEQVAVIGWTQGVVGLTGADFRVPVVHVWMVKDGLVTRVQFLIDNPAMLDALMAKPTHA